MPLYVLFMAVAQSPSGKIAMYFRFCGWRHVFTQWALWWRHVTAAALLQRCARANTLLSGSGCVLSYTIAARQD